MSKLAALDSCVPLVASDQRSSGTDFARKIKKVMETIVRSKRTANDYWNIIKHLSPDAKLDLITMLTKSLKRTTPKRVLAKKYYGIWGDDGMSDDEFVKELKSLRSFNREIIEL